MGDFRSVASTVVRRARSTRWGEAVETRVRLRSYERDQRARRRVHPHTPWRADETVETLLAEGRAVLPQAFDPGVLAAVKAQLDEHCTTGTHLDVPSRDSVRPAGDLSAPRAFLSSEELDAGPVAYRHETNHVSVRDPLVHCSATVPIAFSERLIAIAGAYMGCTPAIGNLNLRTSFVNDLPDFDTQYFHSDPNSPRFLKAFFYLNDVDEDGGPFCYVRGSHREKFPGWRRKYRWTEDEIAAVYGRGRIELLVGKVGDVIIADTTGFHRGTKARARDRSMLTVDYVIHPEFSGRAPRGRISQSTHDMLDPLQLAVADLLEVVPDH